MKPDVSIVLLTWNRAPMLRECLHEMFKSLSRELTHDIIIMDNASTDETPLILDSYEGRAETRIVRNRKNVRLNAYKKLFAMARGRLVIEVDDDVLRFPANFDRTFVDYFARYPDYGYLALNVEQNEKTSGAKPDASCYHEDRRGDMVIEEGPAGGWCAAFRRWHYRPFVPLIHFIDFSMSRVEDGFLCGLIGKIWRKRIGIIRSATCLHATGPAYAREYGLLRREHEKYMVGGLPDLADSYSD